MSEYDKPQVFLSYASPDKDRVLPYFDSLDRDGFNVWIDCHRLKPGQNWDFEIKRAFEKSSIVIAFLSNNSIGRRGYVQREIKLALDKLSEKLVDDIYIIPILLDEDISIPDQFKKIQCISAKSTHCLEQVTDALTHQLGRLGVETQKVQKKEEISWVHQIRKEAWDGLPGYSVDMQLLELKSDRYHSISEIVDFIKGELLEKLLEARASKLHQRPDWYNYGQDEFRRTDTYDFYCGNPFIKGKIISIQYVINTYAAGAPHDNIRFQTYSFVLEPVAYISSLRQIFSDADQALSFVQTFVRERLAKEILGEDPIEEDKDLGVNWIANGTDGWDKLSSFVFSGDGVELLFGHYQVAPFVFGPQFVKIPYKNLFDLIIPAYRSALGIEHLEWRDN